MSSLNLSEVRAAVEPIMRAAGQLLLSYRFVQLPRIAKQDAGFVTEADTAVEQFLISRLSAIDAEISFFAEEQGYVKGSGDYCWVIDPLDGTTNFTYGLPHFCISVALTYKQVPLLGFIYQPLLDEYFVAERGCGAFLNGVPIKVSATKTVADALVLFCIPYAKNERAQKLFNAMLGLSQRASTLRLLGCAALDQCYVACGRLDGLFTEQLAWWDVAAGMLIVQEAGGVVSDFAGSAVTPSYQSYVAANPALARELVALLGPLA